MRMWCVVMGANGCLRIKPGDIVWTDRCLCTGEVAGVSDSASKAAKAQNMYIPYSSPIIFCVWICWAAITIAQKLVIAQASKKPNEYFGKKKVMLDLFRVIVANDCVLS